MLHKNKKQNHQRGKKIILVALLAVSVLIGVTGCRSKTPPRPQVTLTYYKLFEDSDSFAPAIKAFESQNPHITIEYRKFTDPESYEKLLLSEFAEGEGPDIFSMPVSWVQSNKRKITPADPAIIPLEAYQNTFITMVSEDLLLTNPDTNVQQVYGVPLAVETPALYYNQDHYDRRIPEQGQPSSTWEGFASDIRQLRSLNDDNLITRAAAALGRTDNADYGFDVWLNLLAQNNIDFINPQRTKAIFTNDSDLRDITQQLIDYATKGSPTYTWDLSTQQDPLNPIELFATGRLSTLIGYSFTYQQILNQIAVMKSAGFETIELTDVKIAPLPQVTTNPDEYTIIANYNAETVSRTSAHPIEAWTFLRFLIQQGNLQAYYNQSGFQPSPRRDMIEAQRQNGVFRTFANQLSYAQSVFQPDRLALQREFNQAVTNVHQGTALLEAFRQLQQAIDTLIVLTNS